MLSQEPVNVVGEIEEPKARWTLLALAVMAVGIAMRLWFYLYNRSMGRDESALALNVIRRSFAGLWKPLDNDQGAPIGFLMIEKLVVTVLGNHEYALRLVPVVASILALPLFYLLCREFLPQPFAVIALIVLAMNEKQYDYCADAKQYSVDVFLTVALLFLAMKAMGNPLRGTAPSRRGLIALAIAGALAIWFSHPAAFVLGAIGVLAAMEWFNRRPRTRVVDLLAVALIWMASFGVNYLVALRRLSHSQFMQTFWAEADAFAPVPKSMQALIWYKENFFEMFQSACSLGFVGLSALVFVLGVGWLYRRRKSAALALILPIVFALAASVLHKYPFKERLILFICPLAAIFVGAGFVYLFEGQRRAVGIVALLFLLITPLNKTRGYVKKPWVHNEMRNLVSLVGKNHRPDDQLYVYEFCYYPFEYYRDRFGLAQLPAVRGRQGINGVEGYTSEFAGFKGKRVWVMFEEAPDSRQAALMVLDQMGKRVFQAQSYDDYIACYDLR
jgi:hypothetical protein